MAWHAPTGGHTDDQQHDPYAGDQAARDADRLFRHAAEVAATPPDPWASMADDDRKADPADAHAAGVAWSDQLRADYAVRRTAEQAEDGAMIWSSGTDG